MSTSDYFGPPLPNASGYSPPGLLFAEPGTVFGGLRGTFDDIFGIVTNNPKAGGGTGAAQEKAKTQGGSVLGAAASNASETARKAVGLDPETWKTFIRQTATDWGIYAGLFVLLVLGLVFLVGAAGGGTPQTIVKRIAK